MDFKQIEKDYPKSFDKYMEYVNEEGVGYGDYHGLECFFDSVGIHLGVDPIDDNLFDWQLLELRGYDMDVINGAADSKPTRTEAKEAAFLKAFEIYEKQLNV